MKKYRTEDTPGSRLVLNHYIENGVIYGWDRYRALRLCQLANLTPTELGRLVCAFETPVKGELPKGKLWASFLNANHIPPYVALNCAVIESWLLELHARHRSQPPPDTKPIIPARLIIHPFDPPAEEPPRYD